MSTRLEHAILASQPASTMQDLVLAKNGPGLFFLSNNASTMRILVFWVEQFSFASFRYRLGCMFVIVFLHFAQCSHGAPFGAAWAHLQVHCPRDSGIADTMRILVFIRKQSQKSIGFYSVSGFCLMLIRAVAQSVSQSFSQSVIQ